MCFVTTKSTRAITAKTNIPCWKNLQPGCTSFYRNFRYRKNVLTKPIKLCIVRYGLTNVIEEGYHSYQTLEIAKLHMGHLYHKFIIPAGTKYYANSWGEYVSERIIYIK